MELTAQNVEIVFAKCVRDIGEPICGILNETVLQTGEHKQDIRDMLSELPDVFMQSGGGGCRHAICGVRSLVGCLILSLIWGT